MCGVDKVGLNALCKNIKVTIRPCHCTLSRNNYRIIKFFLSSIHCIFKDIEQHQYQTSSPSAKAKG